MVSDANGKEQSDVKEQDAPLSTSENTSVSEPASKGIGDTGVASIRGDSDLIITDSQKYHDELQAHKQRMVEIGNIEQAKATEEEIKNVNETLFEEVQKKHGIKPDSNAQ